MHVVRVYNPTQRDINAMYDGTPYLLPAKGVAYVPLSAAEHFAVYYADLGVRVLHEGESIPQDDKGAEQDESGDNEDSDTADAVCHICGKDFSDKDRPTVALKRHIRLAHSARVDVSDGDTTTSDV